jgi:hypothetical protein
MARMSKRVTLLLIVILAASNLIVVEFDCASGAMTKPSVPEFTVKFVNASYSVTTTNPYTGLSEIKLTSNNSIEVTIRNQRFDYSDFQIYYNIRVRPHFEGDWIEVYPVRNRTSSYNEDGTFSYSQYISDDSAPQSESSFTIINFPVVPTELYLASGYDIQRYYSGADSQEGEYFAFLSAIPDGAQLDFQVEALVGHYAQVYVNDHPLAPYPIGHYEQAVAFDITSGWSSTQTITIDGSAPTTTPTASPSQYPTATPNAQGGANQQGFNWTEISVFATLILIVVLLVAIAHMRRKQTKK